MAKSKRCSKEYKLEAARKIMRHALLRSLFIGEGKKAFSSRHSVENRIGKYTLLFCS